MNTESINYNCRNTDGEGDTVLYTHTHTHTHTHTMWMTHHRGQQIAEFQNMIFKEVKICKGKRTEDGLETAMENEEALCLSLCTGIHGA